MKENGTLPPQAVDLEEAVLGAVLLESDALYEINNIVSEECFYKEAHKYVWRAIKKLSDKNKDIDILTVTNELKSFGMLDTVGGAYFISQLTNRVASSANIETHALIIRQKYILREHIRLGTEIANNAYDETTDIFDANKKLLDEALKICSLVEVSKEKTSRQILSETIKIIESASEKDVTGVPSGYSNVDKLFGGWQDTDFIVIAARPSMGKTAFGLNMVYNMLSFKKHCAVFNLEMSDKQLMKRMIAISTGINLGSINSGHLAENEWKYLHSKTEEIGKEQLHIFDNIYTLNGIMLNCKKLKGQGKLDIVFIDYLQLIKHSLKGRNRENEVSEISRYLKIMAKELDVPIIAFSQLSREVEKRGDKKPILSDLRESGSLEQDADIVGFLYRPEYYGINEDNLGNSTAGLAYLCVAKHRNGALKDLAFKFIPHLTKFVELERERCEHFDNSYIESDNPF